MVKCRETAGAGKELADELTAVDVEVWRAFALRSSLEPMQRLSAVGIVHLLPMFDPYIHGLLSDDTSLPSAIPLVRTSQSPQRVAQKLHICPTMGNRVGG